MANIKLYVEKWKIRNDGMTKVYLQILHLRKKKAIPIGIFVNAAHFDFETMKCKKSHLNSARLNFKISEALNLGQEVLLNLANRNYTFEDIVLRIQSALKTGPSNDLVGPFVESLVNDQKATGRNGNANSYNTALKQFEGWLMREARWSDFKYETLSQFKTYKMASGVKANSVGAYLRAYRAWINEAIRRGLFQKDEYPFHRGLIPQRQRAQRKNVKPDVISKIWENRHSFTGAQRIAVNTILLQFFLQGADFIEVSRLKKQDINDGYIRFTRYKNRSKGNYQEILVKITPEITEIMDESYNDFLVPVTSIFNPDSQYELFLTRRRNFRRNMKEALEKIGITELTSKGIRHTWATIAASLGVSEEIRELAMGHSSGGMQEIYTELDQKEVDLANFKVISFLLRGQADLPTHT